MRSGAEVLARLHVGGSEFHASHLNTAPASAPRAARAPLFRSANFSAPGGVRGRAVENGGFGVFGDPSAPT